MSAAKHTPGRWQAGLPADGGRINVYSDDSMAMRICRVDSDSDFGNHAAANARLIAAAPELLALVERLALLTDEGDDHIKGAAYIDKAGVIRAKGSLLETIEQARAAIAKALGEQPCR